MIDIFSVRNELRRRVILAAGIDAETQFTLENEVENPEGLGCWIAEHTEGGDYGDMTSHRTHVPNLRVQYDLYTKAGKGMETADETIMAILQEFSNDIDIERSRILVPGVSANITRIRHSPAADRNWRRDTLLFTIDCVQA